MNGATCRYTGQLLQGAEDTCRYEYLSNSTRMQAGQGSTMLLLRQGAEERAIVAMKGVAPQKGSRLVLLIWRR